MADEMERKRKLKLILVSIPISIALIGAIILAVFLGGLNSERGEGEDTALWKYKQNQRILMVMKGTTLPLWR